MQVALTLGQSDHLPLLRVGQSFFSRRSTRVIRLDYLEASPQDMLTAIRAQGLEGVIGKRKDSLYEPGKRSGAWIKHRVNAGQEFVIGGYIPGGNGVDSIIVGLYRDKKLIYVARVRNGFVPATRRTMFQKLKPLVQSDCPFVNLPETHKGRWGEGLTADEMRKCVWVQPKLGPGAITCGIRSSLGCARIKTLRRSRRNQSDDGHSGSSDQRLASNAR